jgi:hypothetical protein
MSDLILYTTEDGRSQIKLRAQEQTVWLTQPGTAATDKDSLTVQSRASWPASTEESSVVGKMQGALP